MPYRVSWLSVRSRVLACVCLLVAVALIGYPRVAAHSIDYIGMSFTPSASAVGGSGNWTLTDPVAPGAGVTFDITFSINTQGATTSYPRTIEFAAVPTPAGAAIGVSGLNSHTFTAAAGAGSSFTDTITLTAPSTPGGYSVKFQAVSGTGGAGGLSAGNGLVINFTVAEPSGPTCQPAATSLTVDDMCILLHRSEPVSLSATLKSGGIGLANKVVNFSIDGTDVGSAVTGADGVATLENVNASGLGVGAHDVVATYAGDECNYLPTTATGNLGVQYMFIGYQQPINADGTSAFGGRTIPVKIKLADANGTPVIDAEAHVFFTKETSAIVGTEAEPVAMTNGDQGNAMRYDATNDQYIFNWDIAGLENGTYAILVDLGEGVCGSPHAVTVSLKKKGSK